MGTSCQAVLKFKKRQLILTDFLKPRFFPVEETLHNNLPFTFSWRKGVKNRSPLVFSRRTLTFQNGVSGAVLACVQRWLCLFLAFSKAMDPRAWQGRKSQVSVRVEIHLSGRPSPSRRLINCTLGVSGCILSATPGLAVVSWEAAACVSGDKDAVLQRAQPAVPRLDGALALDVLSHVLFPTCAEVSRSQTSLSFTPIFTNRFIIQLPGLRGLGRRSRCPSGGRVTA